MNECVTFWTVYRLLHKRMLVYIGITSGPLHERLQEHMEIGRADNPLLACMAKARCKLQIEPIDVIYGTRKQAEQRERFYIRELRPIANIQHMKGAKRTMKLQFGNLPPGRCYTCKKPRWVWRGKWACLNCEGDILPPTWNQVNDKPGALPLPDGNPIVMQGDQ